MEPLLHDVEEDDGSTADYECAGDSPDNDRVFPGFIFQRARKQPLLARNGKTAEAEHQGTWHQCPANSRGRQSHRYIVVRRRRASAAAVGKDTGRMLRKLIKWLAYPRKGYRFLG
ncbi:hypothetical protein ACFLV0_04685 [Chloroflexota bacterium]